MFIGLVHTQMIFVFGTRIKQKGSAQNWKLPQPAAMGTLSEFLMTDGASKNLYLQPLLHSKRNRGSWTFSVVALEFESLSPSQYSASR